MMIQYSNLWTKKHLPDHSFRTWNSSFDKGDKAELLEGLGKETFTELIICTSKIPDSILEEITKGFKSSRSLTSLSIHDSSISARGLSNLLEALLTRNNLKVIQLTSLNILHSNADAKAEATVALQDLLTRLVAQNPQAKMCFAYNPIAVGFSSRPNNNLSFSLPASDAAGNDFDVNQWIAAAFIEIYVK